MKNYNHSNPKNSTSSNSSEDISIKLGIIGIFLSTIEDIISSYAELLSIDEFQQSQQKVQEYDERIAKLEKQVQYLTQEIQKQKGSKKYY